MRTVTFFCLGGIFVGLLGVVDVEFVIVVLTTGHEHIIVVVVNAVEAVATASKRYLPNRKKGADKEWLQIRLKGIVCNEK
jgi:hypothetical protein